MKQQRISKEMANQYAGNTNGGCSKKQENDLYSLSMLAILLFISSSSVRDTFCFSE